MSKALELPSVERRLFLRSFWFTIGVLSGVPWLALAWGLRVPGLVIAALTTFGIASSIVWVDERFAWRVYRAWNRRIVWRFESIASRIVMKTCFWIISAAGAGNALRKALARKDRPSAWTPRRSLSADEYGRVFAASAAGEAGGWIRDYTRWARQSDNWWSVSLVPYLSILRLLTRGNPRAAQENIYTLF